MTDISLEEKAKQTVEIIGKTIPRFQDCSWCGSLLACPFDRVAYRQPCADCRKTDKYLKQESESKAVGSIDSTLKNQQVASVFEGNGRTYFVNDQGNIIKDEPSRPLPVGKKDWK